MFNPILVQWRKFCVFVPWLRWLIGMPLEFIIIRHAESDRNAELQGKLFHIDSDREIISDHKIQITTAGIVQAKNTGPVLLNRLDIPDAVIHSGYVRTIETVNRLIESLRAKYRPVIVEDFGFREREVGYTYVLSTSEVDTHFPYRQKHWDIAGHVFARPAGGESLMDVIEKRLRPSIEKMFRRFSGKKIWLVTHGRVIQCLRCILDEMTLQHMEEFLNDKANLPLNCSVTTYRYDPNVHKLVRESYNMVLY